MSNCSNQKQSSKNATYFCCKKNCSNSHMSENKKCIKRLRNKLIINNTNYPGGIVKIRKMGVNGYGKYIWEIQNIDYGYWPQSAICACSTSCKKSKKCVKKKSCCNCNKNCSKISNNIRKNCRPFMKVYNRYGDINYNTVDGWPPTAATPTRDNLVLNNIKRSPANNYYNWLLYMRNKNNRTILNR